MTPQTDLINKVGIFTEIEEFAGFSSEAQRYIRRSLDVANGDAQAIVRWLTSPKESNAIRTQAQLYRCLDQMRRMLEEGTPVGDRAFLPMLIELSKLDVGAGDLDGFDPYRFLYERLLGARARPWLPSAFCAVALMPNVKPIRRMGLLCSVGVAAGAYWSATEPSFHPERIY